MTLRKVSSSPRGDYIHGKFHVVTNPDGEIRCTSPADLADFIGAWGYTESHVNLAVDLAKHAQKPWVRLPVSQRVEALRRYAKALSDHRNELQIAISRAIGKPLWESKTEVDAMIAKVDITVNDGLALVAQQEYPAISARVRYRPIGVCAVIGPFNFPGHLPNGHIIPALATGNTVVYKPSEIAPEVGEIMALCFHEAGFPPGVIQVIQGPASIAKALVAHRDVQAVMFTGSTQVGSAILSASAQYPGRMLALELGGKNSAIVLSDADIPWAVREIAFAAFVTAGQRCTATSRVMVERSIADQVIEQLVYATKHAVMGHPERDDVLLGPVISAQSRSRVLQTLRSQSALEQYEALVPAEEKLIQDFQGYYLSPGIYLAKQRHSSVLDREELFAPVLTVHTVDDIDHAIALANDTRYGLATSVFTNSRQRYEHACLELDVGICNLNRATVGSSSKLPFGGVKDSGNHRAAGLFSSYYCVDPVGEILIDQPATQARNKLPGLVTKFT